MANLFEQKERRVIPNWRSFIKTIKLGELGYAKKNSRNESHSHLSISDYILAWEKEKSISVAGDLISAAFVNGFIDNFDVKKAAKYILTHKKKSTDSLIEIAQLVLQSSKKSLDDSFLNKRFSHSDIYKEINLYKALINDHPYNPIAYVELSRLYSIIGQEKKSIKNMKIALHLAPENRFILRAATRLFAHFGYFDYVHNLIRKSGLVYIDPWIASAEIALATILEKRTKFIKIGLGMINSNNYDWYSLTELASSIGTLEFLNGNQKKAKKHLNFAIISPNDNSLAQIEWINNQDLLLEVNPSNYNIISNYEALALYMYFNKKDYEHSFNQCKNWFLDLPFSKRPIIFGAHIATSLLDNPGEGAKLLKEGLYSHPYDAQIINNLAYSLVLDNKISEAENYINQITDISSVSTNTKICLAATQGLILIRKGQISEGVDLYEKAIVGAKASNNKYLTWLAKLNYARELTLSKSAKKSLIENLVLDVPNNTSFPDINKLKCEVIDLNRNNRYSSNKR